VYLQPDDVDLHEAITSGDAYLARRDEEKRVPVIWSADSDDDVSTPPEIPNDEAAIAAERKWRQQCLIDALASSDCASVGDAERDRVELDESTTIARLDRTLHSLLACRSGVCLFLCGMRRGFQLHSQFIHFHITIELAT
jgi:hypothetical protein